MYIQGGGTANLDKAFNHIMRILSSTTNTFMTDQHNTTNVFTILLQYLKHLYTNRPADHINVPTAHPTVDGKDDIQNEDDDKINKEIKIKIKYSPVGVYNVLKLMSQ